MAKGYVLCEGYRIGEYDPIWDQPKIPKLVVCRKCKRRLKPSLRPLWHSDPLDGMTINMPPHKPKKWWKKKVTNGMATN